MNIYANEKPGYPTNFPYRLFPYSISISPVSNALNKIAKSVRILEKNYFYFPNRKMENNKIRLAFPSKTHYLSKASSYEFIRRLENI